MPASKTLYRFLPVEGALRTLSSWQLRVGRISELNDPHEWRIGFKNIPAGQEEAVRKIADGILKEHDRMFGIFCFSATLSDPVLWSHYADKHRGVCFEVEHLVLPGVLRKVRYTNSRPCLDARKFIDPNYLNESRPTIEKVSATKSCGWEYEREWRVSIDLSECEFRNGHYFKTIPDDFLKRVILGEKCPLEVAEVKRLVTAHGHPEVKVVRASSSLDSYLIRA